MKKYRAIKDVPYWGIKAGEVYQSSEWSYGGLGGLDLSFKLPTGETMYTRLAFEPLLQTGIMEEVSERLTVEDIKIGQPFYFTTESCTEYDVWADTPIQRIHSVFGVFHTSFEAKKRREDIIAFCKELDTNL